MPYPLLFLYLILLLPPANVCKCSRILRLCIWHWILRACRGYNKNQRHEKHRQYIRHQSTQPFIFLLLSRSILFYEPYLFFARGDWIEKYILVNNVNFREKCCYDNWWRERVEYIERAPPLLGSYCSFMVLALWAPKKMIWALKWHSELFKLKINTGTMSPNRHQNLISKI